MRINKREIVVATANEGKIREIREIFAESGYTLRFLAEFGSELQGVTIHENAKMFEGNALIKALVVGERLNLLTLADDSGLCVDALGGEPGVYSARYSEDRTDEANNAKLLSAMSGVPEDQRGCHYVCAVAIYDPVTNFVETVSGEWHGRVATEPRGTNSFGYAPIFLSQDLGYTKTNAERDHSELIGINHRGKAFRAAIEILDDNFT